MQKQVTFKTKGMQRDMSASAFNSEFSYENMNIRIYSTNENTTLSIINEKGTKEVEGINIQGTVIGQAVIDDELILFTREEILTDPKKPDHIYKININGTKFESKELFKGNLNFDVRCPIETVTFYENENNKKVYWTDNKNPLRFINVAVDTKYEENNSFDFITNLSFNEIISVKNNFSGGSFNPGTIQYAFTYVNKNGQQSNIFYTTPLYYLSHKDRGASPEDKVGNTFNIEIGLVDTTYDYLRIYSIHRTSINATPTVKRVVDLETKNAIHSSSNYIRLSTVYFKGSVWVTTNNNNQKISITDNTFKDNITFSDKISADKIVWEFEDGKTKNGREILVFYGPKELDNINNSVQYSLINETFIVTLLDQDKVKIECIDKNSRLPKNMYFQGSTNFISFIDNGTQGDIIDPTELLYLGGEEIICGTLTHKDNTLFLGNIKIKREELDVTQVLDSSITYNAAQKKLSSPDIGSYYSYNNQLNLSSSQLKIFKYLEYYRFGIQAQHYTGRWSNPMWINDSKVEKHLVNTFYDNSDVEITLPTGTIQHGFIKELHEKGYRRIRPVIVYPTINDRDVICQGILCPTVYNVGDRSSNSPFVQSSWFIRPYAPFKVDDKDLSNQDFTNPSVTSEYSKKGVVSNGRYGNEDQAIIVGTSPDTTFLGSWAEFRHNYPIPDNSYINAEIQCIVNPPDSPRVATSNKATWISDNKENYYIDHSIVTLHSPDIEFDSDIQNLNMSDVNLRIVGAVPLTSFISDIDIQTSTPVADFPSEKETTILPTGFYKEPIRAKNQFAKQGIQLSRQSESSFGWRKCIAGIFWIDAVTGLSENNSQSGPTEYGYLIYPWHRNGSLNNTSKATDGYKSAMLDKKKLSNLNFSYKSVYFNSSNIWHANITDSDVPSEPCISGVSIFNSNEMSVLKIPKPLNSNLANDLNYYGNVDKVLNITRTGGKENGYPIVTSYAYRILDDDLPTPLELVFSASKEGKFSTMFSDFPTNSKTGTDPIHIKYKSTPHAVMALNYTTDGYQKILPDIYYYTYNYDDTPTSEKNIPMFWNENTKYVSNQKDKLSLPSGPLDGDFLHGWLWLGELYRTNVVNRFGGSSIDVLKNNQWLPCGEPVSLTRGDELKNMVTVTYEEGDTYYQRYDHLKTYPFTLEDQNAVTEIVSFMCETRVNLDGRYDRNRGQLSNLAVTPQNFNLLNEVYSQSNNFFNYRFIDPKDSLFNFPNTVTWTKTKTAGELVDTWTNITLASTLDLDGDKGKITALRKFNNNIIAFQETGISQVLYNENTQISTTEGVPIEIANSGKVTGNRYLSNNIGCINKWSIGESPNGLYFIDNITKGIYIFNGQLLNISDKFGFHSWINDNSSSLQEWDPVDFNNFVTYYDKINNDVFFISKESCLAFSETLGQFSSFYSYEKTPWFSQIEDKRLWIKTLLDPLGKKDSLWLHNEGEYNKFFGEYKSFYTTVVANPNMITDKIFNNIEFRSDTWNNENTLLNTTFDTLSVWNEYQQGESDLVKNDGNPSNLKQKFRIWRANIPRDKSNGRDRMRNPWLFIKLAMNHENTNKTILHDLTVKYFE